MGNVYFASFYFPVWGDETLFSQHYFLYSFQHNYHTFHLHSKSHSHIIVFFFQQIYLPYFSAIKRMKYFIQLFSDVVTMTNTYATFTGGTAVFLLACYIFSVGVFLPYTLTSKRNANGLKIENKYKQA
jgi:hypothetical protein